MSRGIPLAVLLIVCGSCLVFARPKAPVYAPYYAERKKIETEDPNNWELRLDMAKRLQKAGFRFESEQQLMQVLQEEPDCAEAAKLLGVTRADGAWAPGFDPAYVETLKAMAREALPAEKERIIVEVKKLQNGLFRSFPWLGNDKLWQSFLAQRRELKALQDDAYKTIFDESIYPHVHGGTSPGQPVVDEKVMALRKYYKPYAKQWKAAYPVAALAAGGDKNLRKYLELRWQCDQVQRLLEIPAQDAEQEWNGLRTFEQEILLRYAAGDLQRCITLANRYYGDGLDLENPWTEIIYQTLVQAVKDYNDRMGTSADNGSKEYVRILNEYRVMYNIVPLIMNERLNVSAFLHSKEMTEKGYFAHESSTPGYETPSARAAQEGWTWGAAENIHSGGGGSSAFDGFYRSAGHHRNQLNRGHRSNGTGVMGSLTTVFSARDEYVSFFADLEMLRWK